jgi:hypothetical protein
MVREKPKHKEDNQSTGRLVEPKGDNGRGAQANVEAPTSLICSITQVVSLLYPGRWS